MSKNKATSKTQEANSTYLLKIVLFFILGSIWLNFQSFTPVPGITTLPLGFFIGLGFASHDHFQIDRKIEYAVLLIAAILSFAAPVGVVINV